MEVVRTPLEDLGAFSEAICELPCLSEGEYLDSPLCRTRHPGTRTPREVLNGLEGTLRIQWASPPPAPCARHVARIGASALAEMDPLLAARVIFASDLQEAYYRIYIISTISRSSLLPLPRSESLI